MFFKELNTLRQIADLLPRVGPCHQVTGIRATTNSLPIRVAPKHTGSWPGRAAILGRERACDRTVCGGGSSASPPFGAPAQCTRWARNRRKGPSRWRTKLLRQASAAATLRGAGRKIGKKIGRNLRSLGGLPVKSRFLSMFDVLRKIGIEIGKK